MVQGCYENEQQLRNSFQYSLTFEFRSRPVRAVVPATNGYGSSELLIELVNELLRHFKIPGNDGYQIGRA